LQEANARGNVGQGFSPAKNATLRPPEADGGLPYKKKTGKAVVYFIFIMTQNN